MLRTAPCFTVAALRVSIRRKEERSMKEPVDHILRPQLPWRKGDGITECGFDASKVKTLTREEYFGRLKELGSQRTAMLTCMTCGDTARRHGTWEDDPRKAIGREVEWEARYSRYSEDRGVKLRDELLAIAELIEAHRDEFDAHIAHTEQRRSWNEMKAAAKPKLQASPIRGL
jgi:hypothetical protein